MGHARSEFRRPLRALVNALTVLLLLLRLAVAALWVRGHWVSDDVSLDGAEADGHSTAAWSYELGSSRGGLESCGYRSGYTSVDPVAPQRFSASATPLHWARMGPGDTTIAFGIPPTAWRCAGFTFYYSGNRAGPSATFTSSYLGQCYVQCPHWALFAITACVPLARAWRWLRRRRRRPPGACPGCGYDLRASSDRCPECGRVRASAMNGCDKKYAGPAERQALRERA